MGDNTIQARYPGVCGRCGERYPEGTDIRSTEDDGWVHAPTCPDTVEVEEEPDLRHEGHGHLCRYCSTYHRGECW